VGVLSLGVNWPRCEADHSSLFVLRLGMTGVVLPLLYMPSNRHNCTFVLCVVYLVKFNISLDVTMFRFSNRIWGD
jgi:hypothetical protein